MIVRMWHGKVPAAKAGAYREFLNARAIPDYQSVAGNNSVHILERSEGAVTHFITLTFWKDIESIKAFAGEDVTVAKYYPEDHDFLLEFEPHVIHYEVVGQSQMWLYVLQGIGYGFAAAAQPGPFQTYLISQTLLTGWKRTLPAAFAPLLSDGPIIVLSLLLLSQVPPWFQRFLYIAGGVFVLYLAYGNYKSWKDFDPDLPYLETENQQSIFKAALINALNPNPYIFWSLVTGPILMKGWRESPVYGVGFLTGFYVTMILGFSTIILVFGLARQLGTRVNHVLLGISSVALFCFGLYQVWLGIVNA